MFDASTATSRVLAAIEAISRGDSVVVLDEEDRENEGDVVFAAQYVTPEKINFMCKQARGLICLALEPSIIQKLELPMMRAVGKVGASRETAFTVSIEARQGISTGISAQDRAHTISVAVADDTKPEDLAVPGHIFPLRARVGGVLERAGHTEASVDLCKMSGLKGAAVICEIMNDDGSMARRPQLLQIAKDFNMPIITIPELIEFKIRQETQIDLQRTSKVEFNGREFDAYLFKSRIDNTRHIAFCANPNRFAVDVVDVRVHVQSPLMDVFAADGRLNADDRIKRGLQLLSNSQCAAFVYLCRAGNFADQIEEEFNSLTNSVRTATAKNPTMDERLIGVGSQILRCLGVRRMRVHTSLPKAYIGISGFGLEIVDQSSFVAADEVSL